MITHITRTLAPILVASSFLFTAQASARAIVDRDCSDFATQAAAQAFFLASGPGDPHRLDGSDDDGRACESNPCPGGTTAPQPIAGNLGHQDSPNDSNTSVVRRSKGNVVKVTDGDTLKVRIRGVGIRDVRIVGIDTPEVHGGAQCGGKEASQRMRKLAPVGSTVVLFSDPSQADRDRYGRLLRYVERNGKDVGRAQVNLGQATVYVYNHKPFRRTDNYRRVMHSARVHDRGLWGTCWR